MWIAKSRTFVIPYLLHHPTCCSYIETHRHTSRGLAWCFSESIIENSSETAWTPFHVVRTRESSAELAPWVSPQNPNRHEACHCPPFSQELMAEFRLILSVPAPTGEPHGLSTWVLSKEKHKKITMSNELNRHKPSINHPQLGFMKLGILLAMGSKHYSQVYLLLWVHPLGQYPNSVRGWSAISLALGQTSNSCRHIPHFSNWDPVVATQSIFCG